MPLRSYQETDLETIREAYRHGFRRPLLVQPTGAGKGFLIAYIVREAAARGFRIQFWVNRRTLVHDMSHRLEAIGVDHGVIMASTSRKKPWLTVQVASIDTLRNRAALPPADLVVIDEAHFCVSSGWQEIIKRYPDAKFLLTTATPIRLDGRGLGEIADVMIVGPSVQSLIEQGYLVPSEVYSFEPPDLSGVRKTGGDFNQKQLAAATDRTVLVGDAVKTWLKLASDRKSVSFCVDKKHAAHVAEEYRKAGVEAVDVNDETSDEDRDKIWKDFDFGGLRMVTSVGVISYGWDHPACSCVALLRPTQSLQLHLQQIGRGCRPAPGKTHLLVLDHAGNHHRPGFGHYEQPREWTLEGGLVKKPTDKVTPVATCKACYYTFPSGPDRCPSCGALIPKQHRHIQTIEGELQRLERKQEAIEDWRQRVTPERKRDRFLQLRREAREKGYKKGYPYFKFKAEFKENPRGEWYEIAI
jgi:superfamily II DNA or RNA helicase